MKILRSALLATVVCWLFLGGLAVRADGPILTTGSRVAIVGDSITEQKLYSKYMEAYLLACSGIPDLKVFQFGWGGETATGFANRLENDLTVFNSHRRYLVLRHERRRLPALERRDRQQLHQQHAERVEETGSVWREGNCCWLAGRRRF